MVVTGESRLSWRRLARHELVFTFVIVLVLNSLSVQASPLVRSATLEMIVKTMLSKINLHFDVNNVLQWEVKQIEAFGD